MLRRLLPALAGLLAASAALAVDSVATSPNPSVTPTEIPAAGRQEAILEVPRFGYYSVEVRSEEGVSLQLVDRVAGPGKVLGVAGAVDGRLDALLDRGRYKLVLRGSPRARGRARLEAHRARTVERDSLPLLFENRRVDTELEDHQHRGWWVQVASRKTLVIEAAGRALQDLLLLREGTWLVDVRTRTEVIQPTPGRPLRRVRLVTTVPEGLYQVAAFGGRPLEWAEGSDASPLHVRMGIPDLPGELRRRHVVSPFGEDLFVVPGRVDQFRLELPRPAAATLRIGNHVPADPHGGSVRSTNRLRPSALVPVLDVSHWKAGKAGHLVRIEAPAGQEVVFQHYERRSGFDVKKAGSYLVSTLHPGDPRDRGDVTGVLIAEERQRRRTRPRLAGETAIELGQGQVFHRRLNLLGPTRFLLRIREKREIVPWVAGLEARVQIEPFLVTGSGRIAPRSTPVGEAVILDPGLHVVTFHPLRPGIADVTLRGSGDVDLRWPEGAPEGPASALDLERPTSLGLSLARPGRFRLEVSRGSLTHHLAPGRDRAAPRYREPGHTWDLPAGDAVLRLRPTRPGRVRLRLVEVGGSRTFEGEDLRPAPAAPLLAGLQLLPISLRPKVRYQVRAGTRDGETFGLQVRRLPLDLAEPLSLALPSGFGETLAVQAPGRGTLRILREDGSPQPFRLDGARRAGDAEISPGRHVLRLDHPGPETARISIEWVSIYLHPDRPPPDLDPSILRGLPTYPELVSGAPRFLTMGRNETRTFAIPVDQPGLYRLESTGLLAMEGTLRSRTLTRIATSQESGPGRNFLVQTLLGQGDFQLTARTRGRSTGRVGISLIRREIAAGARLTLDAPHRFTVAADDARVLPLVLEEDGTYTIAHRGDGRALPFTLRDAEGWPVAEPGATRDLTLELAAGRYHLESLPLPVETRRVVVVTRKEARGILEGHGPFPLPLDQSLAHVWREPEFEENPRTPDRFELDLAGPATVTFSLSEGMVGVVRRTDVKGGEDLGNLVEDAPLSLELEPGTYEVEARASRRDDRRPYSVTASTSTLVPGRTLTAHAPSAVPIGIGDEGLYALESLAEADVRATLVDADGRVLARADDREDDWNFLLLERLPAGTHSLRLEAVAGGGTSTRLTLRRVLTGATHDLRPGSPRTLGPSASSRTLTLPAGLANRKARAFRLAATGELALDLTLEQETEGAWEVVARDRGRTPWVAFPPGLAAGGALRARITPVDAGESRVTALLEEVDPAPFPPRAGAAPGRRNVRVALPSPGIYRVRAPGPGRVMTRDDAAARPLPPGGVVATSNRELVLLGLDPDASLGLEALPLSPGGPTRVLGLAAGERLALPVAGEADALLVATLTRRAGQASARLRTGAGAPDWAAGQARVPGAVLAAAPAAGATTLDLLAPADHGPAAVGVALRALPIAPGARLEAEEGTWVIDPGEARRVPLRPGATLVLDLPADALAVPTEKGVPSAVVAGGPGGRRVVLPSRGRNLLLANLGDAPAPIQVSYSAPPIPTLAPGRPLVWFAPAAGILRVDARGAAARSSRLVVATAGAIRRVTAIGPGGGVEEGGTPALPRGRSGIEVHHEAGALLAWLGRDDDPGASLAGRLRSEVPAGLSAAGLRREIARDEPASLRVHTADSQVLVLERPELATEVRILAAGSSTSFPLPAGTSSVTLRPAGGAAYTGGAALVIEDAVPLTEGPGSLDLLGPGESVLYSLTPRGAGRVGVGVRAVPDAVDAVLLDAAGHPLGSGVIQLHELEARPHLLLVSAPADGPPVLIRPAVAGLDPPDDGPPREVLERYLDLATAAREGGSR